MFKCIWAQVPDRKEKYASALQAAPGIDNGKSLLCDASLGCNPVNECQEGI